MLNFTISELCYSDIAKKYGIKNIPSISECDNLLNLIFYVLQPLRDKLGKPIIINSGYRCKALNSHPLIKGANNSQHLTGKAADIRVNGCTPARLIDFIKTSGIEYDQCINEFDRWVHISFNKGHNRKQCFKIS